jgi:hypothetical protein
MHTAEPLIFEPSLFEVKIAIEKLKLPGIDQIKFRQNLYKPKVIHYILRSTNLFYVE